MPPYTGLVCRPSVLCTLEKRMIQAHLSERWQTIVYCNPDQYTYQNDSSDVLNTAPFRSQKANYLGSPSTARAARGLAYPTGCAVLQRSSDVQLANTPKSHRCYDNTGQSCAWAGEGNLSGARAEVVAEAEPCRRRPGRWAPDIPQMGANW